MTVGTKRLRIEPEIGWLPLAAAALLVIGTADILSGGSVPWLAFGSLCLLALAVFALHRRLRAAGALPSDSGADLKIRQTASLLELIGSSTDSIIWAKDRDGRMLYINGALERLAGVSLDEIVGRLDHEWNPNPDDARAFTEADRRVLGSGIADDTEESFTGANGMMRHYRSIRSPLRDAAGAIIGSVGIATDITERREAEQREQLLTRELDHRAKNLLTVVQSVVALTRAEDVAGFKAAVEGRVQALGRAHSLVSAARWEGADLDRVVSEELAAYRGRNPKRITLEGPSLMLKPAAAQGLALVVHELATNALKYGALSVDEGCLVVSWTIDGVPGGAPHLLLRWEERNGPTVAPPSPGRRVGFGSRLIAGSIERQLGGSLHLDWAPTGLVASMEVPLDRALDNGSSAPLGSKFAPGTEQAAA